MKDGEPTLREERIDRDLLEAYAVPEPAPDLADRFFTRLRDGAAHGTRRRRGLRIAAAALTVGVCAAILFAWSSRGAEPSSGALTAVQRTTIAIAGHAVAVAEPGATLAWHADSDGSVRLEQATGDVFYRVDRGGVFVVATRAGEVSVRGTCFRVVVPAGDKATSPVTVHVHEGAVLLASPRGRLAVAAGESGSLAPGRAPELVRDTPAAPVASERNELLARDAAQKKRIAALEARLAEKAESFRGMGGTEETQKVRRPSDMSRAELEELARTCDVPFDLPPVAGSSVMDEVFDEGAQKAGLTDSERAAVDVVIRDFQPRHETALRDLYTELTGADGEALDPLTLAIEIMQKSPAAEISAARQKIAAERAGQRAPPADPAAGSVIERYLRLAIAAPDEFERALADAIGAGRAREFRRTWASVDVGPGCPKQ
jgi:FecR protein